ncbi:hypothetical protein ACGFIE_16305 [Micromonospora sp. NPDC049275]|uniref:hypothetical protein n=1 Tax=Micromonospora sp. NPDC049275 TaxID=3364268 RepID=UPI00371A3CD4
MNRATAARRRPEGGMAAAGADGVRGSCRADDGSAVFTVGSGTYRFRRDRPAAERLAWVG